MPRGEVRGAFILWLGSRRHKRKSDDPVQNARCPTIGAPNINPLINAMSRPPALGAELHVV